MAWHLCTEMLELDIEFAAGSKVALKNRGLRQKP